MMVDIEHWEGVPGAKPHRSCGSRAWCLDCGEWCYVPLGAVDHSDDPETGECSDLLCECCHETLGYAKAWVKR